MDLNTLPPPAGAPAPPAPPAPPAEAPKKRMSLGKKLGIGAGAVLGLAVVGSALGGNGTSSNSTPPPAATAPAVAPSTPASSNSSGPNYQAAEKAKPALPALGEKGNPVPLGQPITVGDWRVTITSADLDATSEAQSYNQFNDAPPSGHRYIAANVEAVYNGKQPTGSILWGLTFTAVGPNNVYKTASVASGSGGDSGALSNAAEVPQGSKVQGKAYFIVPDADVQGITLMVAPTLSSRGTSFFKLH